MAADEDKFLEIVVTKASKYAVTSGMMKIDLPPHVAKGVADQIFFTVDLLKKGPTLTASDLSKALVGKGLGIWKISSQGQFDCGIAIATVLLAIAKFSAAGPASMTINAASLLYDCYSMDRTCGISDAIKAKAMEITEPAYIWMEQGVIGALQRQSL